MKNRAIVAFALCFATAASARAEEPPSPNVTPGYGGQIVVADLAAVGGLLTAGYLPILAPAAAASYLFTPAVIHLLHGRPGRAAGSLGLRLLLPVAGAFIGATLTNCHLRNGNHGDPGLCGVGGLVVGSLTGLVFASVIDAAALAGADRENPPPQRPLMKVAGLSLDSAGVAPARGGASLMLGGRF